MKRALLILAAVGTVCAVLATGALQYVFQVPVKRVLLELPRGHRINPPHVASTIVALRGDPIPDAFGPVGPTDDPGPVCYDHNGHPLPREDRGSGQCASTARLIGVGPSQLASALAQAQAGDTLLLSPGTYRIDGDKLHVGEGGSAGLPIVVRAARLGDARIEVNGAEGILVDKPYWVFENLEMTGVCANESDCDHAFHIVADGHDTILRNNRLRNFNAAVKLNRVVDYKPDDVLIERNLMFNDHARETEHPVTPIDVVAADRLHVVANVIADFGRNGGDRVSYAAFAKGGGSDALFERNLVLCEWRNRGGTRAGLSLGGGGTGAGMCRGRRCTFEQQRGVVRANVVANCSGPGIYLREAAGSRIENNILRDTAGIEATMRRTDARIVNNVIDGHILWRAGASLSSESNFSSIWRAALLGRVSDGLFRAPKKGDLRFRSDSDASQRGIAVAGRPLDFCGKRYAGDAPPLGAIDQRGANCAARVEGVR